MRAASVPQSEITGSQVQVTLLSRVNSVRVSGYSCKVTVSRRQYYCGMLSYITPAAIFEIQKPLRVSVETCRDMIANKVFSDDLTGQKFRLKVPGVVVQAVRESGEGGLHAGRVACRGEAVHVNGHVTSGVVTESYFQIRVSEEYFETDAQKVEARRYHATLRCRYLSGGCAGGSRSYVWSPTPICKFRRAATTGGEMSGQQFIGSDRRIIVRMPGAKIELGNACGGHTARRTQLSEMVAVVGDDSWERLSTIPVANAEERDPLLDVELEREYAEWHTRRMIGGPSLAGCNGAIPAEEAAPVALGGGRFGRRDGAVWYEFVCTERIVQLRPSHKCFKHIPISGSGPQFVHPSSLTFVARSTEVPCPTLMPRKVAGVNGWWQLPAVTAVVAPPTAAAAEGTGLDLRPALFTSAEMAEWTQAIHFPQEKMAMSEVFFQGVCNSEASCPAATSGTRYSLHRLASEMEDASPLGWISKSLSEINTWVVNLGAYGGLIYLLVSVISFISNRWLWWRSMNNTQSPNGAVAVTINANTSELTPVSNEKNIKETPMTNPIVIGNGLTNSV